METGFDHIRGLFRDLEELESAITALYQMQAQKCGVDACTVPDIMEAMDGDDKEALYQVQKLLPQSQAMRSVFNRDFIRMIADVLDCRANEVLIEGPSLFVSRPNDKRLKYKWHSEAHYYPKRRKFLNVWFPVFGPRKLEDGAMSVLPGSHKEQWDFAEYAESKAHFIQYEIPEAWLAGYEQHHCEPERGDVILFDRNLVHRSNVNTTDRYTFSIVARAWTPRDDLTLSGTMSATPYGGDIGRPNLTVKR